MWLRSGFRLAWLGAELIWALVTGLGGGLGGKKASAGARALWMGRHARRIAKVFGLTVGSTGDIPATGLLVCNHISYVDILVLASLTRCVFVAKREVRSWPLLGWCARLGGTVFVDRTRRMAVQAPSASMLEALQQGVVVIVFPEGTSTGGDRVLPFRSALLGPAEQSGAAVQSAGLRYDLDGGRVAEELAYWGDMTLVPHLVRLLGREWVRAEVRFGRPLAPGADRKELARILHEEVSRLLGFQGPPAT